MGAVAAATALLLGGGWLWVSLAATNDQASASGVLGDKTHMGAVHIVTADADRLSDFYVGAVGLNLISKNDSLVSLGFGGIELIRLIEDPEAAPTSPSEAGLYHSAILFPTEQALAQTLVKIAEIAPDSFQGSADHLVSQAFYFGDPDDNGLELYVDRPRDQWKWTNGTVDMATKALDPSKFITDHLGQGAAPFNAATMGHVHLRVGDLARAKEFYADVIGFEVTSEIDGAVFYSAGGYHHHLATNTWSANAAGVRGHSQGLGAFTIVLDNESEIDELGARLMSVGAPYSVGPDGLETSDPWGNVVRVLARG